MSPVIMYDTTAQFAAILRSHVGDVPTQVYVTGSGGVQWQDPQIDLFTRVMRTCQSPDLAENIASDAREIDVEPEAATPDMVPNFIDSRINKVEAGVYVDLADFGLVQDAETASGIVVPRYRLAWWWGRKYPPTRAQVLTELSARYGRTLASERLWACQYMNEGMWDKNVVYGPPDFAHS